MANLVFDPKKGQEAADSLVAVCNGSAVESIVNLYGIVKSLGEDNPIVDVPAADLKKIETYFNEEFVVAANTIQGHFMEYAELAALIQNTEAAAVADGEEMGQIQDTTYDAAKNL